MRTLPESWVNLQLKEVSEIITGSTPSTKNPEYYGGDVPFIKPGDLDTPRPLTLATQYLSNEGTKKSRLVREGASLVSCIGNLGKVGYAGKVVATNQQINSVEFDKNLVDDRFGFHQLKTLKNWMEREASATTISILNKSKFSEAPFLLAPLKEQRRIADKLDTTLARVDALNDRLARIPPLLQRFRQSVLAAATSGRLTEDWRITHQESSQISAKEELSQIKKSQNGKLKIRGNLPKFSEDLLYELPISWDWVSNYELAKDLENSICAGPFGTIFKAHDFRESGVPIVFLRHVGEGKFLKHKPTYMDIDVWEKLHQPYSIFGGELLVTKLGDPPGTACIYPSKSGVAMVTPDVLKMDINNDAVETKFLMHYFNS